MGPVCVGIDPGARETGIIVRRETSLLQAATIISDYDSTIPGARYVHEVLDLVAGYVEHFDAQVVAIEGVAAPSPFLGISNPSGIIGAALVLGALLGRYPLAEVVEPAKNGSGPLAAYPEALRATRGKGAGFDKRRHVRSAWDVAGTALKTRKAQK